MKLFPNMDSFSMDGLDMANTKHASPLDPFVWQPNPSPSSKTVVLAGLLAAGGHVAIRIASSVLHTYKCMHHIFMCK